MEDFTKYENIKIEEICRICLARKEHMSLIYETGLADMLLECASIQVTPENGLFNLVCKQCANEVSRWYVFKQQVVRSFEIGRWLLNRRSKPIIPENISQSIAFDSGHDLQLGTNSKPDMQQVSAGSSDNIALKNIDINDKIDSVFNEQKCQEARSKDAIEVKDSGDNKFVENSIKLQKTKRPLEELVCLICNKQCFTTNSYNRHIRTHDDSRPYVCSKCDKPFKTSQVLAEHMKRHYNDRRYICELCQQKFYTKASLRDHMRSHTGEKPFKCAVCLRGFGTKAILRQHMTVHTVRERKHQCDICNKFFLSSGSLDLHRRKHSGIKPFACEGCDKCFFTKEAMQRHYGAIHDTGNNFLCNVCSKQCSTKVHLSNHMKTKHLGQGRPPNAVCPHCGKQCGSPAELRVHTRVHSGERPFVCELCGKGFIARGNLNSHMRRHEGKKPFLCNVCGKAFVEKSTLKVHIRIHTGEHPYSCQVCGKPYVQSGALKTHLKTHANKT